MKGLSLLARAVLFSLLFNAPNIFQLYRCGPFSARLFTDFDEFIYIPRALLLAQGKTLSSSYLEYAQQPASVFQATRESSILQEEGTSKSGNYSRWQV